MTDLSALGKAAVKYAELGIAVIPLKPRGKEPYIRGGSTNATANVEQVREWWEKHPNDNIGIVCGDVSDGLVAIDIDVKEDIDGWDFINEFEEEHPLPECPTTKTGSGGAHLLARFSHEVRNHQGHSTGVDVRGTNGYIVAPPSIHPNGNIYEWEVAPWDVIPPEDNAAFDKLITALKEKDSSESEKLVMPDVIHEGQGRDTALYKLACSFRASNMPEATAEIALMDYNQRCCIPPMSKRIVRQKLKSAYKHKPGLSDEAKARKADGADGKPGRGRPRKFDHAEIARRLIEERGACMLDGKTPAVRDSNGHYALGWGAFNAAIIEMAPGCTSTNRKEAKLYVQDTAPSKQQSRWNLIAFANGILDVETMEFRDFSDDDIIPNVIPHRWNPDAESEIVFKTLEKLADGDAAVQMNLAEIIGICMARSSRKFHYCPVLIGSGSNGKSTYMKMLKQVLGERNVSALQPKKLSGRFDTGRIVGKLANLADDIANGYLDGDACAELKKAVTGDTMDTDVKGCDGFDFEPYATMVIACNDFPRVADTSEGFMRRLFAIEFAATFSTDDEDYDSDIGEKLATEQAMEYVCKIGIEGLRHVIAQNELTENSANRRIKEEIAESSNSALQWINDDSITRDDVIGSTKEEMYEKYVRWSNGNGYSRTQLSSKSVSDFLKRKFNVSLTRNGHRGTGVHRKSAKEYEPANKKKRAGTKNGARSAAKVPKENAWS